MLLKNDIQRLYILNWNDFYLSFSYALDRTYKTFTYTNILLQKKVGNFWKGYLLFCCLFLDFSQRKDYLLYTLCTLTILLCFTYDLLCKKKYICIKINRADNIVEGQYLWKFNTQYTTCTLPSREEPLLYWRWHKLIPSPCLWFTEKVFDTEWLHEALGPISTPHFQVFPESPTFWSSASELSF